MKTNHTLVPSDGPRNGCRGHRLGGWDWYRFLIFAAALLAFTPALGQTLVIDDQDGAAGGFTLTGNDWTTWGTNGFGFDGGDSEYHYLSHTVGGNDRVGTATWTPDIPTAGTWAISTWFRRTENRTSDADHFITDGTGAVTHITLDQRGLGASGWVDLGVHWCSAGPGGCSVTLDGTDDNQSDEANAVRFVLVAADPGGPDPEPGPDECAEFPGLGPHSQESHATMIVASDWQSSSLAAEAPDGLEAHTPNVDAGEYLQASGWDLCDPPGTETLDAVTIEVMARTQYSSGPYALNLRLHAGAAAQTVFTGTALQWHSVDLTSDLPALTWAGVVALTGQLELWNHPGGERDSDAWVDSWRIVVDYSSTAPPDEGEPPPESDDDDDDDDATPNPEEGDDDDATPDPEEGDDDDATPDPEEEEDNPGFFEDEAPGSVARDSVGGCSCDQELNPSMMLVPGLLLLPALRRRRRPARTGERKR